MIDKLKLGQIVRASGADTRNVIMPAGSLWVCDLTQASAGIDGVGMHRLVSVAAGYSDNVWAWQRDRYDYVPEYDFAIVSIASALRLGGYKAVAAYLKTL